MADAEEHLRSIDEQLKKGVVPARETVRGFLLWFGASRRGYNVVRYIRSALGQFDLETKPNFETAYIDEGIEFVRPGPYEDTGPHTVDPTYRIGRLESANRTPVSVKPEAPLIRATTLMLTHDYSQLPVMTTEREVKGIISWRSIGSRLTLGRNGDTVKEFMASAQIIAIDTSLFDAINIVSEHEYVLVQASDRRICGIVTATDLTLQFRNLAEPFLLIGEIESQIRKLIHGKFSAEELQEICNENDPDRAVESVSDLTFGEYLRKRSLSSVLARAIEIRPERILSEMLLPQPRGEQMDLPRPPYFSYLLPHPAKFSEASSRHWPDCSFIFGQVDIPRTIYLVQ